MNRMTNFRSAAIATGNTINDSAYDNVKKVVDNISDVNTAATSITSINTDATNIDDIVTVATSIIDVITTASINSEIQTLVADKGALDSIYADKATLDRLYASITNLDAVTNSIANVDTVASINGDVTTVATNHNEVVAVSADLAKGIGTNQATDSSILNALTNANAASTQADSAANSASAASVSESNAATSESNALASANASKVSATNAATSETNAAASEAATNADVVKTNADVVTTNNNTATTNADVTTTNANVITATEQATNAASSATSASDSATVATTQATDAANSAASATNSMNSASTSQAAAYNWATYTIDSPVPEGDGSEYSARHWANKAALAVTGSLVYMGTWDATTAYPSDPSVGAYYKVTVAGPESTGPYTYNPGDAIIYNGSDWDLIDGSDKVTSVDGQLGNVDLSTSYEPKNPNIQSHISNTGNPHSVTKAQVGLGNVNNTSDANKPISTATQSALNAKQDILSEGAFINGDKTKLDGIEVGATADQTGAEIKTLYEAQANTNAYTDSEKTTNNKIDNSLVTSVVFNADGTITIVTL